LAQGPARFGCARRTAGREAARTAGSTERACPVQPSSANREGNDDGDDDVEDEWKPELPVGFVGVLVVGIGHGRAPSVGFVGHHASNGLPLLSAGRTHKMKVFFGLVVDADRVPFGLELARSRLRGQSFPHHVGPLGP
jgi:hypothetical protein